MKSNQFTKTKNYKPIHNKHTVLTIILSCAQTCFFLSFWVNHTKVYDQCYIRENNEHYKVKIIVLSDASIQPTTMMIKFINTFVTFPAVFGTLVDWNIADVAKEIIVVVIICFKSSIFYFLLLLLNESIFRINNWCFMTPVSSIYCAQNQYYIHVVIMLLFVPERNGYEIDRVQHCYNPYSNLETIKWSLVSI